MSTLTLGDLTFEVRRSPRRRVMEVIIDRRGELVLAVPQTATPVEMEGFVREKRFRIYTRLAEKEKLRAVSQAKEYVSGESFHYLGRSYRLLVVDRQDVPLKLVGGRFRLRRAQAGQGRRQFVRWYTDHARPWLEARLPPLANRMGVTPGKVVVRSLGHRWASCTPNGTLNFHWASIQLPPSVIDYLILHELAHLLEHSHTPEFWKLLERAMPDFAARKQWLAENGAEFVRV